MQCNIEAAEKYWEVVGRTEEVSIHAALEAAEAGDNRLTVAGHYRRAVAALRAVWHRANGTHLDGVFDPALDSLIDRPLLRYVRHQTAYGARARYQGPADRLPVRPHPSAVGYMEEFLQKVWKDARAGRILVASTDHEALNKTADCPGVVTALRVSQTAASSGAHAPAS